MNLTLYYCISVPVIQCRSNGRRTQGRPMIGKVQVSKVM